MKKSHKMLVFAVLGIILFIGIAVPKLTVQDAISLTLQSFHSIKVGFQKYGKRLQINIRAKALNRLTDILYYKTLNGFRKFSHFRKNAVRSLRSPITNYSLRELIKKSRAG